MPLTPQQSSWLKGLEVAVVTAIVTSIFTGPTADFHTKAGIGKFVAGLAVSAYGAVRLYFQQSPVQNVLIETNTIKAGDGKDMISETKTSVSGPASALDK